MFVIAATAAAALALPTAAVAQDAPSGEAAPFTGFRAEALAGYDTLGDDVDGVVYGGAVGYDFQAGGAVLGIEGEITDSSAKATQRGLIVAGDRARVTAGRDLYVGGRVGFVLSPVAIVYGKAGYTNARFNVRYDSPTFALRERLDADGFRLGAGLEYQVSPNAYLKGEYRYSNYSTGGDFDVEGDRNQILAGIGFRF
jgi:outer membrane immunogenic protein